MAVIPMLQEDQIVDKIFAGYKKKGDAEKKRRYLGVSAIGEPCKRYLWYYFRHACGPSNTSGRAYRLFETGHKEEERMVSDLRMIGCEVHDKNEDGSQFSVSHLGGHISGHMDGCALGIPGAEKTWHVLEFKTCKASTFRKLVVNGVEKENRQHYDQVQLYMHFSGMKRALYMAKNKDNDDIYTERVKYDKRYCLDLLSMAEDVVLDCKTLPPRISERRDYFQCSWCDAKDICHNTGSGKVALPLVSISCRQCCHSTPKTDGKARWACEKKGMSLSPEDQDRACVEHLILPGLVSFAHPIGGSNDSIEFESNNSDKKGKSWFHGKGGWSTLELMSVRVAELESEIVTNAKELFKATECASSEDVLRMHGDTAVQKWHGHYTAMARVWKKRYNTNILDEKIVRKSELRGDRDVWEFEGGRLAVANHETNLSEIWEIEA